MLAVCCFVARADAQQANQVSHHQVIDGATAVNVHAGGTTIQRESHCGCNVVPGGYPCQGPCKNCIMGVDCATCCGEEARWRDIRPMPFSEYGPGGYAGPARFAPSEHLSIAPIGSVADCLSDYATSEHG